MLVQARLSTTTGTTVTVGATRVTPVAQALVVQAPFGALVWNRPSAILVEHDGQTRRLLVMDVTRIVQVAALSCAGILWLLAAGRMAVSRREHRT